MREIKFRAWLCDPDDHSDGYWATTVALYADGWCLDGDGSWPSEECEEQGIFIEQFTGLRDNNGVEIYEGDIVRWNPLWGNVLVQIRSLWVGEDDLSGQTITGWFGEDGSAINDTCEVIGNIHENPELIHE